MRLIILYSFFILGWRLLLVLQRRGSCMMPTAT
jgi:hypothetical protein